MANIAILEPIDKIEFFHEQLDHINFQGYAEMISRESPQLYNFEKEQFLRMYCQPIINKYSHKR